MKRLATFLSLSVLLPLLWVQSAMAVDLKQDHPDRYVVKKGDTLWRIAGMFLQKPWEWPKIWKNNPDIKNPNLIYPGEILYLTYQDGKPVLTKQAPAATAVIDETPVPALPLSKIEAFLSTNRVVSKQAMAAAPHVIGVETQRLIAGVGDTVYARGNFAGNSHFGIYREGQVFKDPDTLEILGYEMIDVGDVRALGYRKDVAALEVTRSTRQIDKLDMLFPKKRNIDLSQFYPSVPQRRIEGKIIAVEDGVNHLGRWDVVIINRGLNNGLRPGNVLAVYKQIDKMRDPLLGDTVALPSPRAGELMVFRVFEKMSYAIVMRANETLRVRDEVTNP